MSRPSDHEHRIKLSRYARLRSTQAPRFRPTAVLVGFLIEIGFTVAVVVLMAFVASAAAVGHGLAPGDTEVTINTLTEMTSSSILAVLVGTVGSILGGYVAARIGGGLFMQHALALGVVSLLAGLALGFAFPNLQPLWMTVVGAMITIPAALLGGAIRENQVLRMRAT